MYNEHRPSTKHMIITAAAWLGGILATVLVVGAITGNLIGSSAPKVQKPSAAAPVKEATVAAAPVEPAPPSQPPTEAVAQPQPLPETPQPAPAPAPAPKPTSATLGVVVIDAGHQAHADLTKEPVGPGSSTKKPRVAGGATGVATHNAESKINLQVALKLRDQLQSRNVRVVMVRTSQDVNISNSERAKIGNKANADLTIRVHCNGAGSSSVSGLMTIYPETNQWTGPIVAESKKAAKLIHQASLSATGAKSAGCTIPPVSMTGFNWSTVPSVIVEMGFMSNPSDDRKLATTSYQRKLAQGMANGIVRYLEAK